MSGISFTCVSYHQAIYDLFSFDNFAGLKKSGIPMDLLHSWMLASSATSMFILPLVFDAASGGLYGLSLPNRIASCFTQANRAWAHFEFGSEFAWLMFYFGNKRSHS